MNNNSPSQANSVKHLAKQFLAIALAQYEAIYVLNNKEYNRLYAQMQKVRDELKHRDGDQRRILLPLLTHSNVQVKLMTANTLLAVDLHSARRALEEVRDSGRLPQCADASGMIRALDDGSFIPN